MVRSLVLVVIALAAFEASVEAQVVQKKKLFRRATVSGSVSLDLATGVYTHGPTVHDRGGATVTDFSNIDIQNPLGFAFAASDTGGGACTWFSSASKGLGMNQGGQPIPGSDLMSDILFYYCSGAQDTRSGGPGGTVELGFYEGYQVFGGAPTTTVTVFTLTGMPGATIPGGVLGAARCYQATVNFSPLVAFADNIFIGYSWHFMDTSAGSPQAATFPIMACVVSCSGTSILSGSAGGIGTATGLGEDGQGMLDVIDVFCTNPVRDYSFTFNTSGPPPFVSQSSISMEIHEVTARATTDVDYNDTAPINNVDTLTATPATIGTTWTASFVRAGGGSGRFQIRVWRDRLGGNGVHPTAGSVPWPAGTAGRRMTLGSYIGSFPPGQSIAGSPVSPTLPFAAGVGTALEFIPLDLAFCGLHFACQARSGIGPLGGVSPRLSSAVEGTIGTF